MSMSLQARVSQLQTRHRGLEQAIHSAEIHPGTSPAEIATLKKRKLLLKDEIARLSQAA
jgi:hypothetical protein